MKQHISEQTLPLVSAALGSAGLLLRLALYTQKAPSGLLPAAHPLHIATVILSIATAVLMLIFVRHANEPTERKTNVAASGAFFAGLWMLPVAFETLEQATGRFDIFWALLSFASVPCLMLTAWKQFRGQHPYFGTNAVICLFFITSMLCRYPQWCGNPQVADYLLPLLACVFLSLAAYQRTAFDFQMGNRQNLLFCSLMAEFFCICALAGEGDKRFYLVGALWTLTNLYATHQEAPHVSA